MELRLMQTVVTKAFDNDKIDGRCLKPFRRTKRLLRKGSNARRSIVTFDQYLKLIDAASPHYRAVLVIALNTGMRLSEIKNLRWSYIDRKTKFIRLPKEATKEGAPKDIPINHHVEVALDALPRALQHDFIITYQGKALDGKSSLKKQFPETCQKAGIVHGRKHPEGITFHDIRRTVKTNMLIAGVDKVYRDSILGHSLKGTDIHYLVVNNEMLTKAMKRYTTWLDGQLESQNVDHSVDQDNNPKNKILKKMLQTRDHK